jgi:hypothetical protein
VQGKGVRGFDRAGGRGGEGGGVEGGGEHEGGKGGKGGEGDKGKKSIFSENVVARLSCGAIAGTVGQTVFLFYVLCI